MQPFGRELVAVVGRHARTTAVANSDLLSKPPIYLGRARLESLPARAPHRAGDGVASGHRVNLLERYDYPDALSDGGQVVMPFAKTFCRRFRHFCQQVRHTVDDQRRAGRHALRLKRTNDETDAAPVQPASRRSSGCRLGSHLRRGLRRAWPCRLPLRLRAVGRDGGHTAPCGHA